MITLDQSLERIRQDYNNLRSTFGIVEINIFGSVARNENRPSSDIDLLITFEKTPSIFFLESVKIRFHEILRAKVDIVVDNDELDQEFRKYISREKVKA